jgi:hypothetical protein
VAKYSDDEASKFTGGRRSNAEGSTYITMVKYLEKVFGINKIILNI